MVKIVVTSDFGFTKDQARRLNALGKVKFYYDAPKTNDAWLSNTDCDGDGKLDRHYGYDSYIGSGAWETNTMTGTDENGTSWAYFVKIAAKPSADYECEDIWGSFCVLMEVYSGEGASFYEDEIGFGAWN
ncbi:MAG: hypothetical protein GQ477_02545 [Nanohaloarchaea archaeon]|nr:hypothetical protein [Candidatus Nanohaloarchaea archaeon]